MTLRCSPRSITPSGRIYPLLLYSLKRYTALNGCSEGKKTAHLNKLIYQNGDKTFRNDEIVMPAEQKGLGMAAKQPAFMN
jgi:hypothetical protein